MRRRFRDISHAQPLRRAQAMKSDILPRKLPKRYAPYLFGLILSGVMSFIVAGIATISAVGFIDGVFLRWITAWLPAWAVAFPVMLVVVPVVRRIVAAAVGDDR
jgi:hypothetical protein